MTDFRHTQARWLAHLRDPQQPAPAGIEERRMAIYRRLLFNNIESFLASTFPVLRSLYDEPQWQYRVRRFYADHDCKTPLFLEIGLEFLDYLDSSAFSAEAFDPPFMAELAHYEYLELAAERTQEHGQIIDGVLTDQTPLMLADSAQLAAYHWPVHQISAQQRPSVPLTEPCFLVVYRNADDVVGFLKLNAASAQLLDALRQYPGMNAVTLQQYLAEHLTVTPVALQQALRQLASRGIVRKVAE